MRLRTVPKPIGKETSAVGNRYQKTCEKQQAEKT
jgi:hypothetical protein